MIKCALMTIELLLIDIDGYIIAMNGHLMIIRLLNGNSLPSQHHKWQLDRHELHSNGHSIAVNGYINIY